MAIFKKAPHPSQDPLSSLRTPASKRISASQRLSTILESNRTSAVAGASANPTPTVPLRSILRNKQGTNATPMAHPAFRSQDTLHSGPPAYSHHNHTSSIADSEDLTAPVEGEKLAQLRRGEERKTRGGWRRLALIVLAAVLIVGLAVGLGVGLTVGRRSNGSSETTAGSSGNTTASAPQFPIGEHSFVTALRTQQTSCTSEASSWRCYPYTTFASSNQTSVAPFNWILANSSASYATKDSGSTASGGVPANLTISSTNNAFSIVFSNQALTYVSEAGNSSNARYTFSISLPKVVIPIPAITSDNSISRCYYNSTVLQGTIWLNKTRSYPDAALLDSDSIGGYDQWPYAVEVAQVSPGGSGIPDCYKSVNGVDGDRIINVLTAQPTSSQCICDYRNF